MAVEKARDAEWAEESMSFLDAVEHLRIRAQISCDKRLGWSLLDVSAVVVVARKAQELGFAREEA